MPRSTHLEYPGALYHVTSRGVQRCPIFKDDRDRQELLKLLSSALKSFDARALAYCLMGNHYHFVIQTRRANLSTLTQRINATYGQAFNRRHQRSGHLFEGRFKAWVAEGRNAQLWSEALRDGEYLGDEAFVARVKKSVALE